MQPHEIVVAEMQGNAAFKVSSFFEKPLVNLVNLRICIRIVRF
jgi:hypothetical protein